MLRIAVAAVALLLSACSDSDAGPTTSSVASPSPTATQSDTTQPTSTGTATTTPSLTPTGGAATTSTPSPALTGDPNAADAPCELYEERWFVWGMSAGDVLYVRAGPGASNPIVTTLPSDARGVRTCYDAEDVDGSRWRAVVVDGEMGWVNLRFLKPEGRGALEVVGDVRPRLRAASEAVRAALADAAFGRLAEFCDEDRGIQFSTDAHVSDNDPVLSCDNLRDAAADDTMIRWGFTDGAGLPIEMTIAERLGEIAGSWALTSTDVLAFEVRVGAGNTIDNLAEAFPGSAFVEYYSRGASRFPGLDWSSVRFVFDTSSEDSLVLLAVVEDIMWTI